MRKEKFIIRENETTIDFGLIKKITDSLYVI